MAPAAALSYAENFQTPGTLRQQPRGQSHSEYLKQVSSHRVASYVPQHGNGERQLSSPAQGRTFEHNSAGVQERDLAKQVASALIVDFGHYRSTHKTIAQKAGVSPETVKRWIAADSAPSLVFFMRLLPHSPSLRKLVAMESDLDPGFQRGLIDLMQRYIR